MQDYFDVTTIGATDAVLDSALSSERLAAGARVGSTRRPIPAVYRARRDERGSHWRDALSDGAIGMARGL
jgi:hypothetical protein